MLLRTKFCGSICSNLFRNSKACARHIESRELQYQCRLMAKKADGDGKSKDPCIKVKEGRHDGSLGADPCDPKPGKPRFPDEDTAPVATGPCKMGSTMPGQKSLMDQLPKPQVGCKFEEERRKTAFKRTFTLLAGILMMSFALFSTYNFLSWEKPPESPKPSPCGEDEKPEKKKGKSRRPYTVLRSPSDASTIPKEVPYLLIGGGTASFSAFRAIKSKDPEAQVLVIGDEPWYPYMRPPLTKELFYTDNREVAKKLKFKQWNGRERSLFYELDDFYMNPYELMKEEHGGVAVARGWTVKRVDANKRIAYLQDNTQIKYEKCLIATGARPRNDPVFEGLEPEVSSKILLYRNIFNFLELEDVIQSGEATKLVIVGGSFLGSEMACSLARRGKAAGVEVTQIFKESGNMGKILPEYLSKWTTKKVASEGVTVLSNSTVEDLELKNDQLNLILNSGKEVLADYVIVALGAIPNTDLAVTSCLEVDKDLGGFLVNAELEARSNLYVAGDCACFYDAKLGRRRVEHHDHAVVSGRLAGENMTGAGKPYFHQSMFWSDLGPDVGYEAIGIVDSSLPTVGVYAKLTEGCTPKEVKPSEDGMRSTSEEAECVCDDDLEIKEKPKESVPDPNCPLDTENYGKGVIFYLRDDIVVGIVLWNIFNRMSIARQVLSENRRYSDLNEVAKLFNIHKD